MTDAQVVLGPHGSRAFPRRRSADRRRRLSHKAIEEKIAEPLGISVKEAALGILKVINNNMALAINANSVAKGIDPRNFTLMGFGGAGPLHAVALAEVIYAKDVIVAAASGHHRGDGPARHRPAV